VETRSKRGKTPTGVRTERHENGKVKEYQQGLINTSTITYEHHHKNIICLSMYSRASSMFDISEVIPATPGTNPNCAAIDSDDYSMSNPGLLKT